MEGFVREFSLRFKDFPSCTALVAGGNLWGSFSRLARKPLSRVFRDTFLLFLRVLRGRDSLFGVSLFFLSDPRCCLWFLQYLVLEGLKFVFPPLSGVFPRGSRGFFLLRIQLSAVSSCLCRGAS